jgi:hypothetical protein
MQQRATFGTVSRGGLQLLVLAAVAAAGVSVGRWVVPEASDGASQVAADIQGAPVIRTIADPLTLDGPAADLAALNRPAVDPMTLDGPAADLMALNSPVADPMTLDGPAADLMALNGPVADPLTLDGPAADLPALNGAASLLERKFAQMDAADAR